VGNYPAYLVTAPDRPRFGRAAPAVLTLAGVNLGSTTLTTRPSPYVGVTLSAPGTDQAAGRMTWTGWNRPHYTERLKLGAEVFREAALEVIRPPAR
jgi:hypothetical protein